MNLEQLLAYVPPTLNYTATFYSYNSTDDSEYGFEPCQVHEWDDFLNCVNAYVASLPAGGPFKWTTTSRLPRPPPYRISSEKAVQESIHGFLEPLVLGCGLDIDVACGITGVIGSPDRIVFQGDSLLFGIEIEKSTVIPFPFPAQLPQSLSTLYLYQRSIHDQGRLLPAPDIRLPVQRAFGYARCNNKEFTVLSTYDYSWFMRCPPGASGDCYISPAIPHTATNPTLLACYAYLIYRALDSNCSPSLPITLPVTPLQLHKPFGDSCDPKLGSSEESKPYTTQLVSSSHPSCGSNSSSSRTDEGKNYGLHDLFAELAEDKMEFLSPIGSGALGSVWAARLGDLEVAVKLVDRKERGSVDQLMVELSMYKRLADVQGQLIPKLFGGISLGNGQILGLVLQKGEPLDQSLWGDAEVAMARKALKKLHHLGVAHGDVRRDNFIFVDEGGHKKALLVDLERAHCELDKLVFKREASVFKDRQVHR